MVLSYRAMCGTRTGQGGAASPIRPSQAVVALVPGVPQSWWGVARQGGINVKPVFSLFLDYEDCEVAFDSMIHQGFDEADMNVIVKEEVAKTQFDVDLSRVDVKATDELGAKQTGLDVFLGTEQPVPVAEIGSVYAAGDVATIVAKTAASPDGGGLRNALTDFDMSESRATAYVDGLANDGILFWIRVDDDRASQVGQILRDHNGVHVAAYGA